MLAYLGGLVLLFLELFVPSGGILGLAGSLCVMYGIWELVQWNLLAGLFVIGLTVVYAVVVFKFWGRRVVMTADLGSAVAADAGTAPPELKGKSGRTLTVLRPSGFAMIDGVRYQVVTDGAFLAKGVEVRVVAVQGNRIVVTAC